MKKKLKKYNPLKFPFLSLLFSIEHIFNVEYYFNFIFKLNHKQ